MGGWGWGYDCANMSNIHGQNAFYPPSGGGAGDSIKRRSKAKQARRFLRSKEYNIK